MRRLFFSCLVVFLITALAAAGVACGGDDGTGNSTDTVSGQRPILKKGDQWKYKAYDGDTEYSLTLKVTDVGQYYTLEMEIDPPLQGIIGETIAEFDKDLMLPVSMTMASDQMGMEFSVETKATYEIAGGERWPLKVGNEIVITESTTTSMDIGGEASTETEVLTSTHKVEAIEEIKVKAGTFNCFRIVKYDQDGEKVSTSWHSDKAKTQIKEIDHRTGEVQELVDYSVN